MGPLSSDRAAKVAKVAAPSPLVKATTSKIVS